MTTERERRRQQREAEAAKKTKETPVETRKRVDTEVDDWLHDIDDVLSGGVR